jgi:hypothetical protein
MVLKPQDLVIALKLVLIAPGAWTYEGLAKDLAMSPSEVHSGVKRLIQAKLLTPNRTVIRDSLREFLIHGLRYTFPPTLGGKARGVPTAHAAEPLASQIQASSEDPPVWPHAEGALRGQSFSPLYRSVPGVALKDRSLYELLALADAVRGGRARERELAARLLDERLR